MQKQFWKDQAALNDVASLNVTEASSDEEVTDIIESKLVQPRWSKIFESLEVTDDIFKDNVPSIERSPMLELKQLPTHLKYVYLGDNEILPVIISSSLTFPQEENLIEALKRHKKLIEWQMADIKGINPSLCMHITLLEDNSKNNIES